MRGEGERCPEDLFARSRLRPLSLVEQRALDAHLAVCGLCRATMLLAELADDIPEESGPDAEARVVRLATRVAYARTARRRPFAWTLAFALGMMVLAVAGVAAALMIVHRARPPRNASALVSPVARVAGVVARGNRRPATAAVARTPIEPALPVAEVAPAPQDVPAPLAAPAARKATPPPGVPRALAIRSTPTALPSTQPPPVGGLVGPEAPIVFPTGPAGDARGAGVALVQSEGPAELFAAANVARGAHALREAVARYEVLQRRFPGSEEAQLSFFSAGDVLMRLGEPGVALAAFDRYLQALPSGALVAEALFARARCLDALGQRPEAVAAWQRLLREYPQSIYESAARRRLAETER